MPCGSGSWISPSNHYVPVIHFFSPGRIRPVRLLREKGSGPFATGAVLGVASRGRRRDTAAWF